MSALAAVPSAPGLVSTAAPAAHASAAVRAPAAPACAASHAGDFPVRTRIHGGPDVYEAGGEARTWYIDLTNTTAGVCTGIHPVVVFVDEQRALRPEQAELEFYEDRRAHPVTFQRTDEDEIVGAFDDGFRGFTVAPGRTLTVKVRLALAPGAHAPNDVMANAAVVQRHEDDGDWVGQSNDYRFRVDAGSEDEDEGAADPDDGSYEAGGDTDSGTGTDHGTGHHADQDAGQDTGTAPGDPPGASGHGDADRPRQPLLADELAGTGQRPSHHRLALVAGIAASLSLTTGGLLLLVARRVAHGRRRRG
ncbi:hypothetical protein ACFY93_30865 [Streptomyces sp. NPDC008313]|uniref:hypothetical protein n=1 Tax=Streptomyces sp. NPDC008313 TaxID=3364826 RepID=UPI0036E24C88